MPGRASNLLWFWVLHSLHISPHGSAGDFVVAFLALMAVLLTGREGRHAGDDVVVVVMMVQV
jgi:hypothetical protein